MRFGISKRAPGSRTQHFPVPVVALLYAASQTCDPPVSRPQSSEFAGPELAAAFFGAEMRGCFFATPKRASIQAQRNPGFPTGSTSPECSPNIARPLRPRLASRRRRKVGARRAPLPYSPANGRSASTEPADAPGPVAVRNSKLSAANAPSDLSKKRSKPPPQVINSETTPVLSPWRSAGTPEPLSKESQTLQSGVPLGRTMLCPSLTPAPRPATSVGQFSRV